MIPGVTRILVRHHRHPNITSAYHDCLDFYSLGTVFIDYVSIHPHCLLPDPVIVYYTLAYSVQVTMASYRMNTSVVHLPNRTDRELLSGLVSLLGTTDRAEEKLFSLNLSEARARYVLRKDKHLLLSHQQWHFTHPIITPGLSKLGKSHGYRDRSFWRLFLSVSQFFFVSSKIPDRLT